MKSTLFYFIIIIVILADGYTDIKCSAIFLLLLSLCRTRPNAHWEFAWPNLDLPKIEARSEVSA